MNTISKAISVLLVISLLCGAFAVITDTDSNANINDDPEKDGILVIDVDDSSRQPILYHITYNATSGFTKGVYEGANIEEPSWSGPNNIQLTINPGDTKMYALAFGNGVKSASVVLKEGANVEIGAYDGSGDYSEYLQGLIIGDCYVDSAATPAVVKYNITNMGSLTFSKDGDAEETQTHLSIHDFADIEPSDGGVPGRCSLSFEEIETILLRTNNNKNISQQEGFEYWAYWYLNSISFENIDALYINTTNVSVGLRARSSVEFENVGEIVFRHSNDSTTNTRGICVGDDRGILTSGKISFSKCENVFMEVKGSKMSGSSISKTVGMAIDQFYYGGEYSLEIKDVNSFNITVDDLQVSAIDICLQENQNGNGTISIENSNLHMASSDLSSSISMTANRDFSRGSTGKIVTDESISGNSVKYTNNDKKETDEFISGKTCTIGSASWLLISANPSPGPEPTPPTPTEEVAKDLTTLAVMISILVVVVVLSLLAVMMARRR